MHKDTDIIVFFLWHVLFYANVQSKKSSIRCRFNSDTLLVVKALLANGNLKTSDKYDKTGNKSNQKLDNSKLGSTQQ